MDKIYTCTCGGQKFAIGEGIITCGNCEKIYYLQAGDTSNPWILEWPKDFNERIRQEEHAGLVAESEPPFTKKLIDKEA